MAWACETARTSGVAWRRVHDQSSAKPHGLTEDIRPRLYVFRIFFPGATVPFPRLSIFLVFFHPAVCFFFSLFFSVYEELRPATRGLQSRNHNTTVPMPPAETRYPHGGPKRRYKPDSHYHTVLPEYLLPKAHRPTHYKQGIIRAVGYLIDQTTGLLTPDLTCTGRRVL